MTVAPESQQTRHDESEMKMEGKSEPFTTTVCTHESGSIIQQQTVRRSQSLTKLEKFKNIHRRVWAGGVGDGRRKEKNVFSRLDFEMNGNWKRNREEWKREILNYRSRMEGRRRRSNNISICLRSVRIILPTEQLKTHRKFVVFEFWRGCTSTRFPRWHV